MDLSEPCLLKNWRSILSMRCQETDDIFRKGSQNRFNEQIASSWKSLRESKEICTCLRTTVHYHSGAEQGARGIIVAMWLKVQVYRKNHRKPVVCEELTHHKPEPHNGEWRTGTPPSFFLCIHQNASIPQTQL